MQSEKSEYLRKDENFRLKGGILSDKSKESFSSVSDDDISPTSKSLEKSISKHDLTSKVLEYSMSSSINSEPETENRGSSSAISCTSHQS